MRVTGAMKKRRYCPNHATRIGDVRLPGICAECGAAGVAFEIARAHKHARTAIRRGKTPKPIPTPRELRERREIYEAYLETPQWRRLRLLVIARDGGHCAICKCSDLLHVHHLHYRTFGNETGEELVTLCKPCHRDEHRRRRGNWRVKGPMQPVRVQGVA